VEHGAAAASLSGLGQRLTVRPRHLAATAAVCAAAVSVPVSAAALEARVTRLRAAGPRVAAGIEVSDLLQDKFLSLVRGGRAVFLQLEAALWEDRRVFDRIVIALPPATWRVDRDPAGSGVLLQDQHGGLVRHADIRQPLVLGLDLGPAARVQEDSVYYLHARLAAASVDERDIDRAGETIFGEEGSNSGLVGLGRFVFKTLLRVGQYLESATTEVTSRRLSGRDIKNGVL
jgi:hypothetical protein